MIDVKTAIALAKASATEMLSREPVGVEEIERDEYKSRDVWAITLSIPRDMEQLSTYSRITAEPYYYKRFLIDAETGEVLAMKFRETAHQ
jgi:hypothetical protein